MNHTPNTEQREREAFEAAFADKLDFLRLSPDAEYLYNETGHAWDGWHARATQAAPVSPEPAPALDAIYGKSTIMPANMTREEKRRFITDLAPASPNTGAVPVSAKPFGYVVKQPDGHETYFKEDPTGMRSNGWPELGVTVHNLFDGAPQSAALPPVTMDEAALLAGLQCLCIVADQEWCRHGGELPEWDQAWLKGQLHVFDLYTPVEKEAIETARAYIDKLCAPASPNTGAVAWLIEWTSPDGVRDHVFVKHNALGDYRAKYPDATARALGEIVAPSPSKGGEAGAAEDNTGKEA